MKITIFINIATCEWKYVILTTDEFRSLSQFDFETGFLYPLEISIQTVGFIKKEKDFFYFLKILEILKIVDITFLIFVGFKNIIKIICKCF